MFSIVAPFRSQLERNESNFLYTVIIVKSVYYEKILVFALAENISVYFAQNVTDRVYKIIRFDAFFFILNNKFIPNEIDLWL